MISLDYFVVYCFVLIITVCAQLTVDSPCMFKLTKSAAVCKLLTDCPLLRDELIKYNRLPQTCGFQDTQPIVCCPKEKKTGDISKKKCIEYSAYSVENNSGPIQVHTLECGSKRVKRVAGGVKASRMEFPHMAQLGFEENESIQWLCGGSIISEQYILTNANCRTSSGLDPKYVRVGITNVNDNEHKQEIKISEVIRHPDHRRILAYNDIALLKLERLINLNKYARPACLYTEKDISAEKAIAIGWGQTSFLGSSSDDLLKVTLDLVDHQVCNKTYSSPIIRKIPNGILDDSQICAGTGKDGKDTCQGDSGGPLQIEHTVLSCSYNIVGLTSLGKGCAVAPGVYTRVSHYIKWIEDTVWPELT